MLSKYIQFENFKCKINKKKYNYLNREVKFNNLLSKYPFLETLTKNYKYSYNKKNLKKFKKFSEYNILGMGGSILGAETIHSFLKTKIKKKFFFFNNLINNIDERAKVKKLNLVISKSGNTLETLSNLNLILSKQNKNKNIIITENKTNILNNLAKKLKFDVIEHKNFIGGRYSVLSEVGMLPAELMGLSEKKFKRFNGLMKNKTFLKLLIKNVISIHDHIIAGRKNSVILNYDEKSDNLFRWYQQLIAESLGKKGKGLFPIISSMPKDNHSLLQLYLDGPKNNFFTFFSVKQDNSFKYNKNFLIDDFKNLRNKTTQDILNAQKSATETVFKKKNIPFRSFKIIKRNEEALGELFCFFILENLLLSKLLKVNPINQPAVELIKIQTKKNLE